MVVLVCSEFGFGELIINMKMKTKYLFSFKLRGQPYRALG